MVLRILATFFAFVVLIGCVPDAPPERDWQQEALQKGAEKVAACQASECTRLDLDGTWLEDFSVLNDMPHVTKLMLSRSNFDDLSQISGMTQLQELHISWTDVNDLSALSAFGNLRLLHANDMNNRPDYAPVYRMTALKELSLDARPDDGLQFVRQMRGLEALFLMRGEIADLSPLAGNRSIKELAIEAATPDDISPILQMRNLRKLDVNEWVLDDATKSQLEGRGITVQYFLLPVVC